MSLEKLQRDVALKLAIVDKSLTVVDEYRKQLLDNAQKVKEDIHEAVARQVGSLRGRERQLVRQVEVVTAHQNCLLSTQQAGLMHSQGALTATKDLLQRCTSADVTTLSKIKMDDLNSTRNVRPVNLVSVQLNEGALNASVCSFGRVQLPETITHHPSPVIPAKVEEYEDEDHDVLHKSVAGAASGPDSPVRVTVQFPRLNQQNWLIGQREASQTIGGPCAKIQKVSESKCNVASWLSNLQISGAQDEEDNGPTSSSIGSFDLMSNIGSMPALSSKSSSIEIVSSHFDSEKEDCCNMSSTCEIENLPTCLEDKSRWLSPTPSTEKAMLQQIRVDDACQANEPCSDFSECICSGECVDSALQKVRQSAAFKSKNQRRKRNISEVYGPSAILSHMAEILSSDNSEWLIKSGANDSYTPRLVKKAVYEAPGEKWLCRSASPKSNGVTQQPAIVAMSTHSNVWLLHKLKAEKDKAREKEDVMMEGSDNGRTSDRDVMEMLENFDIKEEIPAKVANDHSFNTRISDFILASKKNSSSPVDNRLLEDSKLNHGLTGNKPWLESSPIPNSKSLLSHKLSPHQLPQSVLAVAEAGLEAWLMKRL